MPNEKKPELAVQDSPDGLYKQLGVIDSGVFVGFAQLRKADYDELVAAGPKDEG